MRVTAIFLLLYAGADIMLPQYFCRIDDELFFNNNPVSVAVKHNDKDTANDLKSGTESEDRQEEHGPNNEDCFCCCAHLLMALTFGHTENDVFKTPMSIIKQDSVPNPPIQSLYHPPRIV